MPKKPNALQQLDTAGPLLMSAMMTQDNPGGSPEARDHLRTAIYHVTLARLWLICPEAISEAKKIGKPTEAPPLIKDPHAAGNGTPPPPATAPFRK